jgi:hypothetical protein
MLSAQQVERYRWHGYLVPLPALSAAELRVARPALVSAPKAGSDDAALELHERVYRRYRQNYADQITAHDRRYAAA